MGELMVAKDGGVGRGLSASELADLRRAVRLLENNRLVVRMTSFFGRGFDASAGFATRFLPGPLRAGFHGAVSQAMRQAVRVALFSMEHRPGPRWDWLDRQLASRWFASASVAVTGAGGGAGGLAGTLVEFPLTTTLMMRTILQIAREEGEDLASPEARLACLQVFALGGPSEALIAGESGYYVVRMGMAELLKQAAGKSVADALPRLTAIVAARFGVPASWKFAGQAIPAIGAASGALINVAFAEHFRDKARGHFIVRRLERSHGERAVQAEYQRVLAA